MEEQHPIPQQISSYQFHLVGDMTLKQFFQIAGGAIVSLIVYSSNMNPIVKWPVIVVSFLFGVALAFFPFQDRPLTTWLFSFFRSIYSPTVFNWEPSTKKAEYFQPEPLASTQLAQPINTSATSVVDPVTEKFPVQTPVVAVSTTPQVQSANVQSPVTDTTIPAPSASVPFAPPAASPDELVAQDPVSSRNQVNVPQVTPIEVPQKPKTEVPPQQTPLQNTPVYVAGTTFTPMAAQKSANVQKATFTPEAAPPLPPTRPNIVVGQVMDKEGNILESAILEIRDEQGRSVRALRTNKLGHFMIVTPLMDGHYEMLTEKDGYEFTPVSFDAKGEIVPPIQITGSKMEGETQQ